MKEDKDQKEHAMLSLTANEKKALDDISKRVLGSKSRSGMVRYWINLDKARFGNTRK